MSKTTITIAEKKALLNVLEDLLTSLDDMDDSARMEYKGLGTMKQRTRWKDGKSVPVWKDEDETIPDMEEEWGYVAIPEDELSEDRKAKIKAIATVRTALEKLI